MSKLIELSELKYIENCGCKLLYRHGMGGIVEIFDIETDRHHRRKGYGRLVVKELVERTKESNEIRVIYAFTRLSNVIAHDFYRGLGFRIMGTLHSFYEGDDSWESTCVVFGLDV